MDKHYLCLDYGEKHIGVAVATTFVAEPVMVLSNPGALKDIGTLIQNYRITDLVIGLSENTMAEKTVKFAKDLETTYHLPLHFFDETLTSQDTRKLLATLGAKKKVREAKIDHYVAAAILQDFLDSQPK